MDKSLRWRLLAALVVVVVAVIFLLPTYQVYFGMTEEESGWFFILEWGKQLEGQCSHWPAEVVCQIFCNFSSLAEVAEAQSFQHATHWGWG